MRRRSLRTTGLGLVSAVIMTFVWLFSAYSEITVSPLEYDFGEVALGESSTTFITITNDGHRDANSAYLYAILTPDDTGFSTTAPTDIELENSAPGTLVDVGGTLFFMADDGETGMELWKTDGTPEGTGIVKDLWPGPAGSYPSGLTECDGTLYFSCHLEGTGRELCKSDGTEAGTVMVADINPDGWSDPSHMYVLDGTVFFQADDGVTGSELWRTDGTAEGTYLVVDINPDGSSGPRNLTSVNGTLYFTASDGIHGGELWKSDGTEAGTVMVKDIITGLGSSVPSHLTPFQGLLFFTAYEYGYGQELWKSDGTPEGTVRVKEILPGNPDPGHVLPAELTVMGNTLFFVAEDGVTGEELWKSDGTEEGTVQVADILIGEGSAYPRYLTNVNGTLFFSARDGTDYTSSAELWKSDGTEAGTVLVKNLNPGLEQYVSRPLYLTAVGNTLFFRGEGITSGVELWKSDGTPEGTIMVRDIDPENGSYPEWLTESNDTLFFVAYDPVYSRELFRSDGTAGGTGLVKDVFPGGDPSIQIDVTFAPVATGPAEAILYVGGDYPSFVVELRGTGVAEEPSPSELIAEILAYFNDAVADGTLVGSGPGNSAAGRLNALQNMIESAQDLIEAGDFAGACTQLLAAHGKTDGEARPPDFVQGEAAIELAALIMDLYARLGCE